MISRNKIIIAAVGVFVLIALFFVVHDHSQSDSFSIDRFFHSKTLVESETVTVIQTGRHFTVNDLLGEQTYFLHIVRAKHGENQNSKTLIETNTIKIRTLPGCGMEITSGGKVYQITPKRGLF